MKNEIVDVFKHKLESNSCNHLAKNVKSASFEENMFRLKVEFQKTIRVLLPTNKQTVTAALNNDKQEYSIVFYKNKILVCTKKPESNEYCYNFITKKLIVNSKENDEEYFLSFYQLVTRIIHDISTDVATLSFK